MAECLSLPPQQLTDLRVALRRLHCIVRADALSPFEAALQSVCLTLPHTACVSMRRKFTFTLQRACGRIIGRNGDTIRSISRASNAKIIVEGSSGDTREFSK
jgi:hypothetical protein